MMRNIGCTGTNVRYVFCVDLMLTVDYNLTGSSKKITDVVQQLQEDTLVLTSFFTMC